MTIKEEIQIEEYKRTFAEAYKQGFMDAINMCKTEPQTEREASNGLMTTTPYENVNGR